MPSLTFPEVLDGMSAARLCAMARLAAAGVSVLELPGGCVRLMNHHGDALLTHDVLSIKPSIIDRLTAA